MGTPNHLRQFDPARPLVAFDFDGTLTVRDSFMAYLAYSAGPLAYAWGGVRLLPALAAYGLSRNRESLKARSVGVYLGGMRRTELTQSADRFAESHIGRLLRPDAEQAWRDWQASGALMCIVTASPEQIVGPFADRLGADLLLGTRLHFDEHDRITGAFATANCRGQEKVDRLRAVFGPDVRLSAAYGDTAGDTEMLAISDAPGFRVFTRKP